MAEIESDPLEWEHASISDFLFLLEATAGKAADALRAQITAAQTVLDSLDSMASKAQDAGCLVASSDLEPTTSSYIPESTGLMRRSDRPDLVRIDIPHLNH